MYDNGYVKLTALRRDAMLFFPNASHWAELLCPFRAFTAVSYQYSACVIRNCLLAVSGQHSAIRTANKSTNQQLNARRAYKGWKPELFQPHPVRVGDPCPYLG